MAYWPTLCTCSCTSCSAIERVTDAASRGIGDVGVPVICREEEIARGEVVVMSTEEEVRRNDRVWEGVGEVLSGDGARDERSRRGDEVGEGEKDDRMRGGLRERAKDDEIGEGGGDGVRDRRRDDEVEEGDSEKDDGVGEIVKDDEGIRMEEGGGDDRVRDRTREDEVAMGEEEKCDVVGEGLREREGKRDDRVEDGGGDDEVRDREIEGLSEGISVGGLDTGQSSPNCSKQRNCVNAILVTLGRGAESLYAPNVRKFSLQDGVMIQASQVKLPWRGSIHTDELLVISKTYYETV